jgi:hypothetical protein
MYQVLVTNVAEESAVTILNDASDGADGDDNNQ